MDAYVRWTLTVSLKGSPLTARGYFAPVAPTYTTIRVSELQLQLQVKAGWDDWEDWEDNSDSERL